MSDRLREIKERYDFLNGELMKNEICSDAETFRKYSKERADLSEIAETYEKYLAKEKEMNDAFAAAEEESDKEMKDLLTAEGYDCKEQLAKINEELKILLLPKDEADEKGCVLEIRAGAGGEEAALFAGVLCRMYSGYCARKRLKMEAVDISSTELGGVKEAVYQVTGKGAYKYLKYESGVHRVQRVPETETQGRIHTSTATVAVLPEAENVEVEINEKDIRVDIFHSGGAGGQNVNKVASAVRITHFPTGIVVQCQNERSQLQNKEMCFNMLRSKLLEKKIEERQAEADAMKGDVKKIEWGSQIRSYVFHPYTMVKDHRTNVETGNIQAVMDGDIDMFIEGYLQQQKEKRLAKQTI